MLEYKEMQPLAVTWNREQTNERGTQVWLQKVNPQEILEAGSRTHSLTELDVGSSFPEKHVKALFMNTRAGPRGWAEDRQAADGQSKMLEGRSIWKALVNRGVQSAEITSCIKFCLNACVGFSEVPPPIRNLKTHKVFNFMRLICILGRKILGFDDTLP